MEAFRIPEPRFDVYQCPRCGYNMRFASCGDSSYDIEIKRLKEALKDAKAEAKHYHGVAQKKSDLNAAYKAEALLLNRKLDGIRKAIYAG